MSDHEKARAASENAYKRAISQPSTASGRDLATVEMLKAIYFELRHQTALIQGDLDA